jgi:hypothetical protein
MTCAGCSLPVPNHRPGTVTTFIRNRGLTRFHQTCWQEYLKARNDRIHEQQSQIGDFIDKNVARG